MTKNAIFKFSIDVNFQQDDDPDDVIRRALYDLFRQMAFAILYDKKTPVDFVKLARLGVDLVCAQEGKNTKLILGISECNCDD